MNRAALIDQIQQARETLLQSAPMERDRFVSPPLSVPEGIPANVRNCRRIRSPPATNRPGKRQKRSAGLWSEELGEFPKISREDLCDERSLSH